MAKKDDDYYADLLKSVQDRKKVFEQGWWKRAEAAEKMYESPKSTDQAEIVAFNILYANTEILLPSLYSSTPRPDVTARWDAPKEPAMAAERLLTVLIDDNTPGSESFDLAMEGATLSALVPGAGGVRLRSYTGEKAALKWEEFKYNTFLWGYARKWSKVPWIAFMHSLTKDELQAQFRLSDDDIKNIATDEEDSTGKKPTTWWVYEVWDKKTKKVCYLCDAIKGKECLREEADPMGLAGFYPTPGPLTLVRKPKDLEPSPLFDYYRNQAEELNRVTVRLNRILAALRVRGAYNSLFGDAFKDILDESSSENSLVPTKFALNPEVGLDKQMWLMPLEKLVQVAQQLYTARQSILQVIYQLTGLADIVRGASVASETATAQQLKNKWGTIRLKRMQRTVEHYVRDLLRLAVDAATVVFPQQQWAEMTGLQYPTAQEKQQAVLAYQEQAMLAGPDQPPAPPPPILKAPTWEDVLSALTSDSRRSYIIDVETSSTLEVDAAYDREEVVQFMQAMQGLAAGLQPLVALGPQGMAAAKSIILAVIKRFKLGREVEGTLKDLPVQSPPQPGQESAAEVEKAKADTEKMKAQAEIETMNMEMAFKREEHAMKMRELQRKEQIDLAKHQRQTQQMVFQAMNPPPPPAKPAARRA